ATVVVERLLRGSRRRRVERIAAPATDEQATQQHGRTAARESLVPLQLLLRAVKHGGIHDRRHRNLDPLVTWPISRAGFGRPRVRLTGPRPTSGLGPLDELCLAKGGTARVCRIAQHAPDRRPIPCGLASSSRNAAVGQFACNTTDAPLIVDEPSEDLAHDVGLERLDLIT